MQTKVEVVSRESMDTLEIRAEAPQWKMPGVVGKSYQQIGTYLQELKAESSYVPYIRYVEVDWKKAGNANMFIAIVRLFTHKWKMLIGFPVATKLPGKGDIVQGAIPKGQYIRALHHGSYVKVSKAYKEILAFAKEKNLRMKNESIEFYLNDPEITKQQDLETEILVPIE